MKERYKKNLNDTFTHKYWAARKVVILRCSQGSRLSSLLSHCTADRRLARCCNGQTFFNKCVIT